MTGKIFRIGIACLLAGIFAGGPAFAFESPQKRDEFLKKRQLARNGIQARLDYYRQHYLDIRNAPKDDSQDGTKEMYPFQSSIVDELRSGASLFSTLDADTVDSPGIMVGVTSYDSQANNEVGREVATNPGSNTVHFAWTMWDRVPLSADDDDRFVNYNSWSKSGGAFNQGFNGTSVSLGDFARGGFSHIDTDGANTAHVSLHQQSILDGPYSAWHLHFPFEGTGLHLDFELPKPTSLPGETEATWTDVAISQTQTAGVDDVWHVITLGSEDLGDGFGRPSDRLWYFRLDNSAASPAWEGPALLDSSTSIGYALDASDVSADVCMTFQSDYITDGYNQQSNLCYRESYNRGADFIDGTALGEVNKYYVTTFSDATGPQAWSNASPAYDNTGDLHIVYVEQRYSNISEHASIKHWSKSRGTSITVALGYYDNDFTWGGQLNLTTPSLGVGDGATMCQGGLEDNDDYLYVTYVKQCGETLEEENDVSQLQFCNGEIYLTGSNSGGDTWSPPINLTNTKLPGCRSGQPDSVCVSEYQASIARKVSDIEIFYIRDYESGDFTEAPWAVGRAMYLNFPGGTQDADYVCPLIAPGYAAFTSEDKDCEFHTNPGTILTEDFTILNLGNAQLAGDISITGGGAWLSLSQLGAYSVNAGAGDLALDMTMDATALTEDLYVGEITVTHNDTSRTSPQVYPIEFFVVQDFKCPEDVILKTAVASPGVLALQVESSGRFGYDLRNEGGMWRFLDSSLTLSDASLLAAHGTQAVGDTLVFFRFGFDDRDPGQRGWRALTDLVIDTSTYSGGTGYATASADLTTADSVLGVKMEWFFPQDPVYDEFVVAKYTLTNRTAGPISDVALSILADVDVIATPWFADELIQDGGGNHGNYVAAQNLIYMYGYDSIGHPPAYSLESSARFSGGVTYMSGRDATGAEFFHVPAPMSGSVQRVEELGGEVWSTDRPNSQNFYDQMNSGAGVTIYEPIVHPDTGKDLIMYLNLDQGRTLAADQSETYVVAWVSDTLQHAAFEDPGKLADGGLAEVVDSAWSWAERNVYCACSKHTDPQVDGVTNVIDVVLTVNVAFKGATPVFDADCPYERTDVDCTGFTNVIDVVKIVNVAFKGLTAASQFCNGCTD